MYNTPPYTPPSITTPTPPNPPQRRPTNPPIAPPSGAPRPRAARSNAGVLSLCCAFAPMFSPHTPPSIHSMPSAGSAAPPSALTRRAADPVPLRAHPRKTRNTTPSPSAAGGLSAAEPSANALQRHSGYLLRATTKKKVAINRYFSFVPVYCSIVRVWITIDVSPNCFDSAVVVTVRTTVHEVIPHKMPRAVASAPTM